MFTTKIVLLSEKGKIADAIADLLPNSSVVRRLELLIDEVKYDTQLSKENIKDSDAIILNLSTLEHDGARIINALLPLNIPIIVLHLYHQKTFAEAFLKMGASAYLPVNFYAEDLLLAIDTVLKKKLLQRKTSTNVSQVITKTTLLHSCNKHNTYF